MTLGLAAAGYSALACLVTFPLVLQIASRVPFDLEDSLWYVIVLRWNAHVVPLTQEWWDGFAFYPATGMMSFSDHMLGASLIASPLQWMGLNPLTAYNLTFLATFPLSALAAHALAWTLTRRHDAAAICGLAFGFNPYRMAHLPHLELLMAFGMPAALAALHQYMETRRVRWLAAFSVALVLLGLSASYYTLFFTVLGGMWAVWFVRPRAWRDLLAIVAAGSVAALALLPIAVGYARIHDRHNLARDIAEVRNYSADVTSIVTASSYSALWGWTAPLNGGGERQLFPGLAITVLAIAGVVRARRRPVPDRGALARLSKVCWALSICAVLVAAAALALGPWRLDWGWMRISVSGFHKPLSLSLALAILGVALSPRVREAFRQRSAFAFYLLAAATLFLCSLGPAPTFLGVQVLYEAPYAWLMRLPLFSDGGSSMPSVRVPARFAMLAILALSVAGSLAFARLACSMRRRIIFTGVAAVAIVADGWTSTLPMHKLPTAYKVPGNIDAAAVMELPLGRSIRRDTAAMYRTTHHQKPTLNGYGSYAPLSYHILRTALNTRDHTVLDAVASLGPVLIAANDGDPTNPWSPFVASYSSAVRIGNDANWTLFRLPRRLPSTTTRCDGPPVPITAIFDEQERIDSAILTDRNPETGWQSPHPQRAGDRLTLQLAGERRLCGILLSMGPLPGCYPRSLRVATALGSGVWEVRFRRRMGGAAFLAALENPHNLQLFVPLGGARASVIELQLEEAHPRYPWAVADIVVQTAP